LVLVWILTAKACSSNRDWSVVLMGTHLLLSSTTLLEPSSKCLGRGERIRVAAGHFMLGGGSLLFAVEKRSEV